MRLLFDTRPLLKLLLDQPGGDQVQRILRHVEDGGVEGHVSAITLTELWYLIARRDELAAARAVSSVQRSLELIPIEGRIALLAGKFKSSKAIPIADAIIAASASVAGATIVTDDDGFLGLGVETADEKSLCKQLRLV